VHPELGPNAGTQGSPAHQQAGTRRPRPAAHHRWWEVEAAISDATHTIRCAVRAGAWTPRQRQRPHQLDPGTWPQAAPGAAPGWQYNLSGNLVIEIAIYPDIVRLAAYNLQPPSTGRREAP
jgi:hypothetical protein